MVALALGMLFAALVCHLIALNYSRRWAKTHDPLHTCSMLVFTGFGFIIMGLLGCICCRYLPDHDFYLRTKIASFGLLLFGCFSAWLGSMLRKKLTQKKPGNKKG